MLNTILGGSKATEPRSDADYQNAKQIAANGSDEERVALASDEFLEPEILYYFANDPSPDVRSAVAGNPSMPPHAAPTLAKDENAQVRSQLADTLGNTLPSIDPASNQRATSAVYDALDTLAQDSLEDIRSVIAESLKELDSVPKPIVSMLARDVSDRVSMPVLELSPLISDDELVEIIQSTDSEGRLCAISRRENLPAVASASIVETGNSEAIATLLQNTSVEIDDPSMEAIAQQAETDERLHAPLLLRPALPEKITGRVLSFVGDALIDQLASKGALNEAQLAALREKVSDRLGARQDQSTSFEPGDAEALHREGKLDDRVLQAAIGQGNVAFVREALALKSSFPVTSVDKLLEAANPDAIVALVWKSKLDMSTAVLIQSSMLELPGDKIRESGPDGSFPLPPQQMEYFLNMIVGATRR